MQTTWGLSSYVDETIIPSEKVVHVLIKLLIPNDTLHQLLKSPDKCVWIKKID